MNGSVENIPQSEYIKNDRTRNWILALEHIEPKLVEIFYDFYKDFALLEKGDPETLKKYRLKDIFHFNLLIAAIKKVQTKDEKLYKAERGTSKNGYQPSEGVEKMWDDLGDTMNNNIARQYRYLKSKGIPTDHLEPIMKKYGLRTDLKTAGLREHMAEFVLEVEKILILEK
ncbi:MAG: hypothetical protein ACK42F_13515 [Sphingobacteriales bacterium]